MSVNRRTFLGGATTSALAALTGACGGERAAARSAQGPIADRTLDDAVSRALDSAKRGGATYADVRIVRRRTESVYTCTCRATGPRRRACRRPGVITSIVSPRPIPRRRQRTSTSWCAGRKRGLLVTRFWYNRMLEPQSVMITGLTRDGLYLIEDGKITAPVTNFRYNESPVTVLKNVDAMTRATERTPSFAGSWYVPALRTHEFTMASPSAAV